MTSENSLHFWINTLAMKSPYTRDTLQDGFKT